MMAPSSSSLMEKRFIPQIPPDHSNHHQQYCGSFPALKALEDPALQSSHSSVRNPRTKIIMTRKSCPRATFKEKKTSHHRTPGVYRGGIALLLLFSSFFCFHTLTVKADADTANGSLLLPTVTPTPSTEALPSLLTASPKNIRQHNDERTLASSPTAAVVTSLPSSGNTAHSSPALSSMHVGEEHPSTEEPTSNMCWRPTIGRGIGQLPLSCPGGSVRRGLDCFEKCREGFSASFLFPSLCYERACPAGFRGFGPYVCLREHLKRSYGRTAGRIPDYGCKDNEDFSGGLCYAKCPEGYTSFGPTCWKKSRSSFFPSIKTRVSSTSLPKPACRSTTEDLDGLLCYPKCRAGYYGVGPVCWQHCNTSPPSSSAFDPTNSNSSSPSRKDEGEKDGMIMCYETIPRKTYRRQLTLKGFQCKEGLEMNEGLCYKHCPAPTSSPNATSAFTGVGPVCWGKCPPSYPFNCGVGCARSPSKCLSGVKNELQSTAEVAASVLVVVLSGGAEAAAEAAEAAVAAETEGAAAARESTTIGQGLWDALGGDAAAATAQEEGEEAAARAAAEAEAEASAAATEEGDGSMDEGEEEAEANRRAEEAERQRLQEEEEERQELELIKQKVKDTLKSAGIDGIPDFVIDPVVKLMRTTIKKTPAKLKKAILALDVFGVKTMFESFYKPICPLRRT